MKKNKAFTLIELILTIVVVSIISIPASLVLSQYISSFSYNEQLSEAVQLGRMELEKIYNTDYENITSQTVNNYENSSYRIEREVTYNQGGLLSDESLKEIRVRVYPQGKDKVLNRFLIYRAKNVEF